MTDSIFIELVMGRPENPFEQNKYRGIVAKQKQNEINNTERKQQGLQFGCT